MPAGDILQSEQNYEVASASSVSVTLPGAVTAASTLLAAVMWSASDRTPTLSDGVNSWEEIGTHAWDGDAEFPYGLAVFRAPNVGAQSAPTVTANFGGNCADRTILVAEVADLGDIIDTAIQEAVASGAGAATSPSISPPGDSFILGAVSSIVSDSAVVTQGSGFTLIESVVQGDATQFGMEGRTWTGGAIAATWTLENDQPYTSRVVAFELGAGGENTNITPPSAVRIG